MPTRDRGAANYAPLGTVRETSSLWVLGGVDGTNNKKRRLQNTRSTLVNFYRPSHADQLRIVALQNVASPRPLCWARATLSNCGKILRAGGYRGTGETHVCSSWCNGQRTVKTSPDWTIRSQARPWAPPRAQPRAVQRLNVSGPRAAPLPGGAVRGLR
jgi:hypothetical protein